MLGQTISHYRIDSKLGEGGMGVVYKAHDLTLKRNVALKFLPYGSTATGESRARLIREAQAAAALLHPNICPVYEIGDAEGCSFIAMAYLEGRTLRERLAEGPVPIREALEIALQIGEALAVAHASGIVHRDLKPANVMLTAESRPVLMDFGLAQMSGATRLTQTGTTMGTAAYMSPEQILGGEVDARSDVWALGVLLYEMVSGTLPFRGDNDPALAYAIVHEEVEPLSPGCEGLPVGLDGILAKALAREAAKRYPGVGELMTDLSELAGDLGALPQGRGRPRVGLRRRWRRWTPVQRSAVLCATAAVAAATVWGVLTVSEARAAIDSLVVLPLQNLSGDPEQEYFADGMTDQLITNLAQIGSLKVISRTSAMQYKGVKKPLPQIARELGVDAVIEGSVLRAGERVRITTQLVRAKTDRNVWAQSYERDLRDILGLQNEIAQTIAGEVQATITPEVQSRLSITKRIDPEAYQAYIRARYLSLANWTPDGIRMGIEYFQKAIDLEPSWAEPHAGLALSYLYSGLYYFQPSAEAIPRARAAAEAAIELDQGCGDAHAALSLVMLTHDWDWSGADRESEIAVTLSPSSIEAVRARCFVLITLGKAEESIAAARRELELDPLSPATNLHVGYAYYYAGRFDESIAQYKSGIDLYGKVEWVHLLLAQAYQQKRMWDEAFAECEKALAANPEDLMTLVTCGWVYGAGGQRAEALALLDRVKERLQAIKYSDPVWFANLYDGLGDVDRTIEYLNQAYEQRAIGLYMVRAEFMSERLRSDTRYKELLRRMKFPEN